MKLEEQINHLPRFNNSLPHNIPIVEAVEIDFVYNGSLTDFIILLKCYLPMM